jgi:hypothetical protein
MSTPLVPSIVDGNACIKFNANGKEYSMLMPNDTLSPHVFMEVFAKGTYPIVSTKNFHPKVILDIGGFIGDTGLFFHIAYPNAVVHVYEPAAKNLFFCEKNLKDFPQIKLHPYGLASETRECDLYLGHRGPQNSIFPNPETTQDKETI